ncbi:MAG: ATP-binding protein [Leptolyngbyaceae cyanobacterium]
MALDIAAFYRAANPSRPIQDPRYYIDFSTVRGGDIVEELARTIIRLSPDEPTTQLLTGHIGSGKSTELLRLKTTLEAAGYHVVYFESDRDLEMSDVEVTDILMVIARQIATSLETVGLTMRPSYFQRLFQSISDTLQMPIEISELSLSAGFATLTAQSKDSAELRGQLHQYLEPRTKSIIDAINQELLEPAIQKLKAGGKAGLVAIVDNLDRVAHAPKPGDRLQPEYLFVDRGDQLKRLACHVLYTIPLSLVFSDDLPILTNRFGVSPSVLTMVPVHNFEGDLNAASLNQLRQMVLARAFPEHAPEARLQVLDQVFGDLATLDRLCTISGGHMRNLMRYLYGCLRKQDPPLQRATLERVIRDERNDMLGLIDQAEWRMLFQAVNTRSLQGESDYNRLLRSLFLYEYRDERGRWVDLNPVLAETEIFRQWQTQQP